MNNIFRYISILLFSSLLYSFNVKASCGDCAPLQCSQDSSAWSSVNSKKEFLRGELFPDRLVNLVQKTGNFCASCVNSIDSIKIRIVQLNNFTAVRPWSPPVERQARIALKAGNIKAFYLYVNEGKKCSCCDRDPYDEQDDYDKDLDINRNGPIYIFESPSQVGTDQTRGHYSQLVKSYPPVLDLKEPVAPRVVHTFCSKCTQKEEALNAINSNIYALATEIYSLTKQIDIDERIVIGLHNNIIEVYNDATLSETAFYQDRNEILQRQKVFKDSLRIRTNALLQKRTQLEAYKKEQIIRQGEFTQCRESRECNEHRPIFENPRPLEEIGCNTITDDELKREDYTRHLDDLLDLKAYLYRTSVNWKQCKENYTCVDMNCSKMSPILGNHLYILNNIKVQHVWARRYKETVDKYYSNLISMTIQSQKNLNELEWLQALQTYFHNLGSSIINVVDIARVVKSLAAKPPTNINQDTVVRKSVVNKLLKVDQAFEAISTTVGLINTLTSGVQFPFVEGEGIPVVRMLNKFSISMGLCIKGLASELVDSLDNVKGNSPDWRDNVLAFIAKAGLCISTYQMMEREKLIEGIKKDLLAEEVARKSAYGLKSCVGQKYDKIQDVILDLENSYQKVSSCIHGPCEIPEIPKTETNFQSYGPALKHFESILKTVNDRFYKTRTDIQFQESRAPEIKLSVNQFLPGERMSVEYSIPWCQADSSFIAILDASEGPGNRSIGDITYEHQMFRGKAKGKIQLVTPVYTGDFDIRIYDNASNGNEVKRAQFQVAEILGELVDQGDFTEVYLGDLEKELSSIPSSDSEYKVGHGRISIDFRDAKGKLKSSYIRVLNSVTGEQVIASWRNLLELPVGTYDINTSSYHPSRWVRGVVVQEGKTSIAHLSGDGRLMLYPKDGLEKSKNSHVTIKSLESDFKLSTWNNSLDLPPGRYNISFSSYTPNIVHDSFEVVKGKRTSIKTFGYGRLKFDPKDALGANINTHITVKDHRTQHSIWKGWSEIIDLPPGSYDISFDNYFPPIVVENFQVTRGLERIARVGGYGRLSLNIKDGIGNLKNTHIRIAPLGSQKHVYAGWNHTVDLPPGEYNVEIDGFYPALSAMGLIVEKGKEKRYLFDAYGRLSINVSAGNLHRTIYYAGSKTVVVSGWNVDWDLKPGLYDVLINENKVERWARGIRVSSQARAIVNF